MKIISAIFLTFIIFVQTFSSFMIEANFFINQDYIAKNLCVNRDKPMMHCNGKCFLTKKIKEEGKNNLPVNKIDKFEGQPFFLPASFEFNNRSRVIKLIYFINDENPASAFTRSIFHPPSA